MIPETQNLDSLGFKKLSYSIVFSDFLQTQVHPIDGMLAAKFKFSPLKKFLSPLGLCPTLLGRGWSSVTIV